FDPQTKKQVQPEFVLDVVTPARESTGALDEQRYALSERVRQGELFGFLEIGPDVYTPAPPPEESPAAPPGERGALRYQSNSPTYTTFSTWAEKVVNDAVQQERFDTAGLPR